MNEEIKERKRLEFVLDDDLLKKLGHKVLDAGQECGLAPHELGIALGLVQQWLYDKCGITKVSVVRFDGLKNEEVH